MAYNNSRGNSGYGSSRGSRSGGYGGGSGYGSSGRGGSYQRGGGGRQQQKKQVDRSEVAYINLKDFVPEQFERGKRYPALTGWVNMTPEFLHRLADTIEQNPALIDEEYGTVRGLQVALWEADNGGFTGQLKLYIPEDMEEEEEEVRPATRKKSKPDPAPDEDEAEDDDDEEETEEDDEDEAPATPAAKQRVKPARTRATAKK